MEAARLSAAPSPAAPLRVAIVDDHPLYRDMLSAVLRGESGIEVAGVFDSLESARVGIRPGAIDVAVLDADLPDGNGVVLGTALRRADPRVGILLVSSHDVMEYLIDLPRDVRHGWGYLSKNSPLSTRQTVVDALRAVALGVTALDPDLVGRARPRAGSALAQLSPRQLDVLRLVARGLSNAGVAEQLGISARSVENHLNLIYAALDVPDGGNARVSAVLRFIEDSSRV